jgi:hypothetical protein
VDRLGRTEERLSKVAERLEERVRKVEDGLLKLAKDAEGLEKIVVAKASADAQTAAARTVLDRLERVFDRLAHIEAQLPPRPLPPERLMDRRD